MSLPAWSISVLKSTLFQQTAPVIILFLIPAFVFFVAVHLRRISFLTFYRNFTMGIESWGFSLPWLWSSSQTGTSSSASHRRSKRKNGADGRSSRSRTPRSHAEQIALDTVKRNHASDKSISSESEWEGAQYYPGLVNISGTYCFMNSTLQALASLTYLQPQIDAIHAKAESLDVPTPVIDALHELFIDLNTPKTSYHSLRPHGIISALSSPSPLPASSAPTSFSNSYRPSTSTTLFNSREHQDAQELFQLVSECIKNEMGAVDKEGMRDRGIAGVLDFGHRGSGLASKKMDAEKGSFPHDDAGGLNLGGLTTKSVFDGLTANRRSCVKCGYTEAVMHFGFDNWQLAMPRLATSCRLEDCLEDYTRLEILKDCVCRKCSVLATHRRLLQELRTLEEALDLAPQSSMTTIPQHPSSSSPNASPSKSKSSTTGSSSSSASTTMPSSSSPAKPKPSASKKRRYKDVKRMEQSVRIALSEGRIEDEDLLTGVRLERVVSPASTKQAMIARPPPVLALHLNRSVHYGQFASKNMIKVHFPEVLDLTPYTTSGSLSTVPTSAISTPSPPPPSLQASPQMPSLSFSSSSPEQQTPSTTKSQRRSKTPTRDTYRSSLSPNPAPETQRTIYRLTAVVCHYGQHSFGHYVCYRRKPRRDKKNLAGEVPILIEPEPELGDREEEEEEEEESDSRGLGESEGKGDVDSTTTTTTNGFADPCSAYSRFSPQPSSYHWQDRSETLSGSGTGWLRISDDSVGECGIESVLAEGSGAFMLYYEKAVWGGGAGMNLKGKRRGKTPMNGVGVSGNWMDPLDVKGYLDVEDVEDGDGDADRFSIGSEETLRPKIRVVDLNGSVGSLVSEVGIGVMKQKKDGGHCGKGGGHELRMKDVARDRESPISLSVNANSYAPSVSLSSSTTSLKIFGPRIVRSINARGGHSVGMNGSAIPGSEMVNGEAGDYQSGKQRDKHDNVEDISWNMTASAPSILQVSNLTNTNSSSSTAVSSGQIGLGSKSTKMMMQHATNLAEVKVKAR